MRRPTRQVAAALPPRTGARSTVQPTTKRQSVERSARSDRLRRALRVKNCPGIWSDCRSASSAEASAPASLDSRHAAAAGRIRAAGVRGRGRAAACVAGGRPCARRRAEPRQRDEDTGRRARARRRPQPDRGAAHDRDGRERRARDRRDGHLRRADPIGRRPRCAPDPGRGRGHDRRRPGAEPRHGRREPLRQRPDQPPPAADGHDRLDDDDPRARDRADGDLRRVLPGRVLDGRDTRARC